MTGAKQSVIFSFPPCIASHELSALAAGPPPPDEPWFSAQAKHFKAFIHSDLLML